MRKIDKNFVVFPDYKSEESEIKEMLEGKSKYGEVSAVVLLDPGAYHQVKAVYILEEEKK